MSTVTVTDTLSTIQSELTQIRKLLSQSDQSDVEDFMTTIRESEQVIMEFNNSKVQKKILSHNDFVSTISELQKYLKEYSSLLIQLKVAGRLERFLTSNRLRKKLEEINFAIHVRLQTVKVILINAGEAAPTSQGKTELKSEQVIDIIADSEGKEFWSAHFGLEAFWVEWPEFIAAFENRLNLKIDDDENNVLRFLIDNSNLGVANQHKFSEFLKAFGPLIYGGLDCIKNMKLTLREKWFYGFLSKVESEHLLAGQESGTFLIRFSKSRAGSFAIAFVSKAKVYHILINTCKPVGFKVYENQTKTEKTFRTLLEIVKAYEYALKKPLVTTLPFESWFWGDTTTIESAELLQGKPAGSFLVRFSSTHPGNFAVSYVSPNHQIRHLNVNRTTAPKYEIDIGEGPNTFDSVAALVDDYKDTLLTKPLINPLSEIKEVIAKWTKEIVDLESNLNDIMKQFLQ